MTIWNHDCKGEIMKTNIIWMNKTILLVVSLFLLSACGVEKDNGIIDKTNNDKNQFMIRYNVSAFPEMYTTNKIMLIGPNTIQFVDQNGVSRRVHGTFEIVTLKD